jgi:hypothetical protein
LHSWTLSGAHNFFPLTSLPCAHTWQLADSHPFNLLKHPFIYHSRLTSSVSFSFPNRYLNKAQPEILKKSQLYIYIYIKMPFHRNSNPMMTITAKDKELRVFESVFLKILKKFLYFLFKIKFFYIFKSFLYTNIVK